MESIPDLVTLERQNEEMGKGEFSETTNTSIQDGESSKRIRNSKGQRDYICGCSKAYLSYAAIYTHVRNKHGGIFPKRSIINNKDGMPQRQFNILGKSNKHSITVAGNTPAPTKTPEVEKFLPELRHFLKLTRIPYQHSEVTPFAHSETVHESSDTSR